MTVTKEQLLEAMQDIHKRLDRLERMLDEANAEAREHLKQMRVLAQTLADKAKG